MTQLNTHEVESAIEDSAHFEDWSELEYGECIPNPNGGLGHFEPYRIELAGETCDVKVVEETGGTDEGSHASVTVKVGNQHFRKEGYYASHYGHDWDGRFYEVRPEAVSVTRFRET